MNSSRYDLSLTCLGAAGRHGYTKDLLEAAPGKVDVKGTAAILDSPRAGLDK